MALCLAAHNGSAGAAKTAPRLLADAAEPSQTKGTQVALKVGDRVRTAAGLVGEIVVLTKDGISAYVRPVSKEKRARANVYRLDELTKIDKAE
jgi:preprotein translocase subunit YajC